MCLSVGCWSGVSIKYLQHVGFSKKMVGTDTLSLVFAAVMMSPIDDVVVVGVVNMVAPMWVAVVVAGAMTLVSVGNAVRENWERIQGVYGRFASDE